MRFQHGVYEISPSCGPLGCDTQIRKKVCVPHDMDDTYHLHGRGGGRSTVSTQKRGGGGNVYRLSLCYGAVHYLYGGMRKRVKERRQEC